MTAAHSTKRTRELGTDCTYRIPGDSVHQDAKGRRVVAGTALARKKSA